MNYATNFKSIKGQVTPEEALKKASADIDVALAKK